MLLLACTAGAFGLFLSSARSFNRITTDIAEQRSTVSAVASAQREILRLGETILQLDEAADFSDIELHRDLLINQLRAIAAVPSRGDLTLEEATDQAPLYRRSDIVVLSEQLQNIDWVALEVSAAAGEHGELATASAEQVALVETELRRIYNLAERRFYDQTSSAVRIKSRSERSLAVLVAATFLAATAWVVVTRRRSRSDVREAHDALYVTEQRFSSLVQNSSDVTLVVDAAGRISYASPAANTVLGHDPETLLGASVDSLVQSRWGTPWTRPHATDGTPSVTEPARARRADGAWAPAEVVRTDLLDDPGVHGVVFNVRDISDRDRLERQIRHWALYDPLTNLANRTQLHQALEEAARRCRDGGPAFAVLLIDLDGFKHVNDAFGHHQGDQLLVAVAQRLTSYARSTDTVARLGGDEFVLVAQLSNLEAGELAARLVEVLSVRYQIDDVSVDVGASIGVRICTGDTEDVDQLLRDTDLAMYAAKEAGRNTWRAYAPEMHVRATERVALRSQLRHAIEHGEFVLHYQPIFETASGHLTGFEALVRWMHPERGLLPPGVFIPVAEESGLIVPLGLWILEEACRAARLLDALAPRPLTMSVNLSGRQLASKSIVDAVRQAVDTAGLAPSQLVLELTESMLLSDREDVIDRLGQLRALGVTIALDDFGTGFSSLSYLQHLPIDIIKIDRSFLTDVVPDTAHTSLLAAIIRMCETLGLPTVAEGVETDQQLAALRELRCPLAQGFGLGRPTALDGALSMIAEHAVTRHTAFTAAPAPVA